MYVHLTLVPHLGAADELKTKPTQHSVRELRGIGISPDAIVCRTQSSMPMPMELKEKIALFCDVPPCAVVQNGDAKTIYQVPLNLEAEGWRRRPCASFALPTAAPQLDDWSSIAERLLHPAAQRDDRAGRQVRRAQGRLHLDQRGALPFAASTITRRVNIQRIDSELVENEGVDVLKGAHGDLGRARVRRARRQGQARARSSTRASGTFRSSGICYGMQLGLRRVRAQRLRAARRDDQRS